MTDPVERKLSSGSNAYDERYALLTIGDSGVGKSCLLLRFAEVDFVKSNHLDNKGSTRGVVGSISRIVYFDDRGGFQGEDRHDQWISHKITDLGYRRTSKTFKNSVVGCY